MAHRGRLLPGPDLITRLATGQVCNQYGSAALGKLLQPIIETAVRQEGYRYLPVQAKPVIMNVKEHQRRAKALYVHSKHNSRRNLVFRGKTLH